MNTATSAIANTYSIIQYQRRLLNLAPESQSGKHVQRHSTAKNDTLAEKSWGTWPIVSRSQRKGLA